MGKSARKRKSDERKKKKAAAKAAKRAKYAALAGTSKKQKNIVRRSRSGPAGTYKHAHKAACCGNPGCKRCYPQLLKLIRRKVVAA